MLMILQDSEGNVASATCNIQYCFESGLVVGVEIGGREMTELLHELVFPVPVDAERHGIVHEIVLISNRVEELVDH